MDAADQMFASFNEWLNWAFLLTAHKDYHPTTFRAICFDTQGRLCSIGKDFMRARDEGTFPIRWVWPDQVPAYVLHGFQEAVEPPEVANG